MNILEEICLYKRQHVIERKSNLPFEALLTKIENTAKPLSFLAALQKNQGKAVIAEVKRASPSKGIIDENPHFDPVKIAQSYAGADATCLSVLTDEPYFKGKDEYLTAIRNVVSLPLLRKDFMIDAYQIYESRALGADCVLLIMAALSDDRAKEFYQIASDLGMDVLVEVHDEEELQRALTLKPKMIGVNNRNLKTMEVSLETSLKLASLIPGSAFKISESGIATPDDISRLQEAGFGGFLIGEAFMKMDNKGAALGQILQQS